MRSGTLMDTRRRDKIRHGFLGVLAFLLLSLVGHFQPLMQKAERLSLDQRYARSNRKTTASTDVVVIDIDDQTLKNLAPYYGRWPWPRRVYKEVIEFLSLGEPAAILLDILFTEQMKGTDDDAQLAEASAAGTHVSHAFSFLKEPAEQRKGVNPLPMDFSKKFALAIDSTNSSKALLMASYRDYEIPPDDFYKKINHAHAVTVELDIDGKLRRIPLLFNYDKQTFPSLALAGILAKLDSPKISANSSGVRIRSQGRRDMILPTDSSGQLPLHFYDVDRAPPVIAMDAVVASALQLQKGEVSDPTLLKINPYELKGKVILIGASASGLNDLKATPLHPSYPGVLLQATAISNALKDDFLTIAPRWINVLIGIFILAVIYTWMFTASQLWLKICFPFVFLSMVAVLSHLIFRHFNLAVEMAFPGVMGLAATIHGLAYLILVEEAAKRKLKTTLSKYVSPVVADKLLTSGIDPRAEIGAHKELSILFSDIRGFTTISESLPPQQIVVCLNTYLSQMNETIFEHLGTVDKFIGDGLMAFWGAPLDDDFHAVRAVRCALAMLGDVVTLRQKIRDDFGLSFDLEIGIGINTGNVVVGNIGSERHLSYTAIGDNVNLASRIEGITKVYQVPLLIGERTYDLVKQSVICRVIDNVQVKGKLQHVKIYQALVDKESPLADQAMELSHKFQNAWTAYEIGDFKNAHFLFKATEKDFDGDKPSQIYQERCKKMIAAPPKDWKGIYVLQTK